MTRFISTLGFSGNRVTRPIIAKGVTAGDRVILLSPDQSEPGAEERTAKAAQDVENTLGGVVHDIDVTTEALAADDFAATTDRISEIIAGGPSPVICLGAGATDVLFPAFVAALAHREYIQDIMMFSDVERGGVSPNVPDITAQIPGRTRDVFAALAARIDDSPATVSELADAADRSVSTASRHVDALVNEGLVQKHREAQKKTISLTPTGRIFARKLELDSSEEA